MIARIITFGTRPMKLVCALAALFLCACGGGFQAAPKGDISSDRSAAFKSFMPGFADMGKVAKGDDAYRPKPFQELAARFKTDARIPFEHFQSDPQGNGDALPEIWTKPAEFAAARERFFAAADKLDAAAKSEKLDDIRTAYGETEASCKACHQSFRRPK